MKLFFSSLLFVSLLFNSLIYSQGEGALVFATLQQSPLLLGAGQIGAAVPNDDVLGFYFNPAMLGYSAKNNHASVYFQTKTTEWMWNPIKYHNYGINLGYNLEAQLNFPISIGFGFLHNKFDYGTHYLTSEFSPEIIGEVDVYDIFNCFSLGVGIDYYVKMHLGVSLKTYDSQIGANVTDDNNNTHSIEGTMLDYGAILIFPISELLLQDVNYQIANSYHLSPITNISFGYSLQNFGDEIYYVDPSQKDPLSRTARLGYTFDFGVDLRTNKSKFRLINYSFTAEAQDILVESRTEFSTDIKYQGGIGDISISKNILDLKSDNDVIVHKGHIIKLLDTIILTSGRFSGHGYSSTRKTSGLGFTSVGIFKLINNISQNEVLNYITKHFVFEYFNSDVEFLPYTETNFEGLSIHFKGFEI